MKKFSAIFLSLSCAATLSFAQETKVTHPGLSPLTRHYLEQLKTSHDNQPEGYIYKTIGGRDYISALIQVSNAGTAGENLRQMGAIVGTKAGSIWTVQVPVETVKQFSELGGISYIQLDEPVFPAMDIARTATRVDSVHKGINLPTGYNGKNVVVGVIDFGFDYNHPAFYDTTGSRLRVKKAWELNGTGTPPAGYAYGAELADTNAIHAATTDNADQTHGTCVAGMAAGSGLGGFTDQGLTNNTRWRGMAYDADLVFVGVRRDKIETQWRQGGFSDFADGINYIFRYANSVSKPAVVNISWGSQSGAHDGTSLFNKACDSMSGAGKIIVMSAGNEGQEKIHISKSFTATDTVVNTFLTFTPATYQRTWVDVWGDPGKTFCGKASLYRNNAAVNTTGFVCLDNNVHSMYILGSNGTDTCYVEFINTLAEQNGKPRMTVNIYNKTTDTIAIAIKGTSGNIHMWDEYYYYGYTNSFQSAFSNMGQSWAVSGDTITTVSDMGAAQSVLLVGASVTKRSWRSITGLGYSYPVIPSRMAPFSSIGPMVDGRIKPDIAAPGMTVGTSSNSYDVAYTSGGASKSLVHSKYTWNGRDYYYAEFSGTSAASPAAAGIVALMLQVKPTLTPAQAKDVIFQTAIQDTSTGVLPAAGNNLWGHGKINAYGAVKMLAQQQGVYNYAGQRRIDCVLFPNPGDGHFTLDYNGLKTETLRIEVYNITGKLITTESWPVRNGANSRELHLAGAAPGNYMVRVSGADGSVTIKTVIR